MAVEHDFEPHRQTWNGFVRFMQIGSVSVAVLLILMAIFLL
ncbi:MAG: aa3-type cytochrome c oxidase subunit IV [Alphaproteobacteria bacterium]|nr:aa3-type cytochrome c oxidase subunit IV [Alphaproteobacteria bacterium]